MADIKEFPIPTVVVDLQAVFDAADAAEAAKGEAQDQVELVTGLFATTPALVSAPAVSAPIIQRDRGVAFPQIRAGVNPRLHLRQFAVACANPANSASGVQPVVCIAGDSTGLENGNNNLFRGANLFGALMRRIREDNPGVSIRFNDRSIGGQTWASLSTSPPEVALANTDFCVYGLS